MKDSRESARTAAVCSFIGHREIFDADIESKLQLAVNTLVKEYESVEFMIYPRDRFYHFCLLAALRVRTFYPGKVAIVIVLPIGEENYLKIPSCVADKTISLCFGAARKENPSLPVKKTLRWLYENSTHLITYNYEKLFDSDCVLPKKTAPPEIISLISSETEAAILKVVPRLKEKEQIVFNIINEGGTLKNAGMALGVSQERARQHLIAGQKTIKMYLRQRRTEAGFVEPGWQKRTCGLFALGEPMHDTLTKFKDIIRFLDLIYDALDIYVEFAYAASCFSSALANHSPPPYYLICRKPHITAMASRRAWPEDDDSLDMIPARLCPPCHAVGYVSRVDSMDCGEIFDVIADMIERMDFCLCDLSSTPFAEKIREYAARTQRTVLLDMSRRDAKVDEQCNNCDSK